MEMLHTNGIVIAEVIQHRLVGQEKFWLWVTYLGDPKSVFCMYFPIAYYLDRKVGVAVLWIALISEWLNLVFKWLLFGERPYWWIHETETLSNLNLTVRQFPSTCETGPGSPSGHCMITGAALWPVVIASSKYISQHFKSCGIKLFPIILYLSLMFSVGFSRIFILAHFPHQVLAGIVMGIVLGHVLIRTVPDDREFRFYVNSSLALLLGASLLYWTVTSFGFDLSWSIELASKWCSKPEWLRLDTRPFSSVTRCAGSVLGLGLTVRSALYNMIKMRIFKGRDSACCMVLALIFLYVLEHIPLPTGFNLVFYCLNYLKNIFFPLIVMTIVPSIVLHLVQSEVQPRRSQ